MITAIDTYVRTYKTVPGIGKGVAQVTEACCFTTNIVRGGTTKAQTNLVVTFVSPLMAQTVIREARRARRNAANEPASSGGARKQKRAKAPPAANGQLPFFAYDLTPANQALQKRMNEQVRSWVEAAKEGEPRVDAWCDVSEGIPVLLRRAPGGLDGRKGAVTEYVWLPEDQAQPERGRFVPGSHRKKGGPGDGEGRPMQGVGGGGSH
jgi:hypothetical protein